MSIKVICLVDAGWFCPTIGNNIVPPKHYPPADVIYHHIVEICSGEDDYLTKILYYDSVPYEETLTNPISGMKTDYSNTPAAHSRRQFLNQIIQKDKLALRRGKMLFRDWTLTEGYFASLLKGSTSAPTDRDIRPDLKQKGVDMKIGLDMAAIA